MKKTQGCLELAMQNIKLGYEEVIDTFSVTAFLTQKTLGTSTFFLPSASNNGF